MDLSPLLMNQRVQQALSKSFTENINTFLGRTPTVKVSVVQQKSHDLVMGISFIRLNFLKGSQLLIIGTNDKKTLLDVKNHPECQKFSEALASSLKISLESEVISLLGASDFKKTFVGQEDLLGIYKKCETNHYLKIELCEGENTEDSFQVIIPITTHAYQPQYLAEEIGFVDQSKVLIIRRLKNE
jgi:hypothetical protein